MGFFPRRATTAAASRPEASPGRLARCIRVAGLKKLPRFSGRLLRSQTNRSKPDLTKGCQSSTKTEKTLKNEYIAVKPRQDARRAAVAAGAAPTDICFSGQPRRGDGRDVEPARLDTRRIGGADGLGALRPGDRAPRLAGPGISVFAGERIVAKTHVGARYVGRGERVGNGHGRASAAMSLVAFC